MSAARPKRGLSNETSRPPTRGPIERRNKRDPASGRTSPGQFIIRSVLEPHAQLASDLLDMIRARNTGDPTHRFQIAGVMVFLAGVDKSLSLTLELLYLAGHVDWNWLIGGRRKAEVLPGTIECGPGLTAKLRKIQDLGLSLPQLPWLVELRNWYVHDCRIYAGYRVTPNWEAGQTWLLRPVGPEVSTLGPPLFAIDAPTLRAEADALVRRLGSLLDRKGGMAAWRALQKRLSQLPYDPQPELSRVAAGTPDTIHQCITALNEQHGGIGLRKMLVDPRGEKGK